MITEPLLCRGSGYADPLCPTKKKEMPEWSKFNDIEIEAIKQKMNQKFDKAMIVTLSLSPLICLIMPYIPGRRGEGPMIDRMSYWDAVLKMSIIWFIALIGVWIWNYYKSQNQFSKNRKFLKKKKAKGKITDKSKGFFVSFENLITTNLDGNLRNIKIENDESTDLNIGDVIEVEFEKHTSTILKVSKLKDS